jgi:hypothetical protein
MLRTGSLWQSLHELSHAPTELMQTLPAAAWNPLQVTTMSLQMHVPGFNSIQVRNPKHSFVQIVGCWIPLAEISVLGSWRALRRITIVHCVQAMGMAGHSKWHNIRHKKGAEDAKKAILYSRIG